MQVAPTGEQAGIRVTMKDHSFFIPLNSKGMKARALGVLKVKQHAKEHADHLEGEGAYLVRNADGTATEVTFVAEGVELRSWLSVDGRLHASSRRRHSLSGPPARSSRR